MNNIKPHSTGASAPLPPKRKTKLLARLLRMLVRCSGIATTEEVEALHNEIREINDSVEIIARELNRQDTQSRRLPALGAR
jgi:hypothetical protein